MSKRFPPVANDTPNPTKPECRRCKHVHDVLVAGERIIVTPILKTSPGWCYSQPKGVIIRVGKTVHEVTLDNGDRKEVAAANVKRLCGWKPPNPRPRRLAAFAPHKPLAEGPWSEPTFDEVAS